MLNPNHPDDERLSALADHDLDVVEDQDLAAHVESCTRCADLVAELGALRASLAELPDIAPVRPLRLLPSADEPASTAADGLAGWVRRLFAPALTAGAALALVGLVGTAVPALEGSASGPAMQMEPADSAPAASQPVDETSGETARALSDDEAPGVEDSGTEDSDGGGVAEYGTDRGTTESAEGGEQAGADSSRPETTTVPAERSPWPMVLFTGLALVVGAIGLRWILVPRAG